ncbi:HEAT repeat-containing protein 5B-like isoform X2 [Lingula anatina]|nr:HEAT repeat-containing protein 5B-like isoform X2 [Lingula anatina]|eukprot:XP_013379521.1 HEAT repeat-containing protein 5B-like isoform X2 [Lingula anatina]
MELAHSLLLNEDALQRIQETKRPVFIFEWLRFLDKVLVAAQKSDIKESQKKLISQLTAQISGNHGPPSRKLLARCLATLFSVGDTFALFETINTCNDIIKNKDDSPSYLPTRLAAIACIGGMYEKLGRMVGRSFEETVQLLIKALKNAESTGRCEIMVTLQKVVQGLGSAACGVHKDIYKATKSCMTDRSMTVRCAAAKCLEELVHEAPFMYTTETEAVVSLCFRALDGSNYDVRCSVAELLGRLLEAALTAKPQGTKGKQMKLEDVLNLLSAGFLKGGSGFLKSSAAGEMIKGGGTVNREIRVGVTHAYVQFVRCMGGTWLEKNIVVFLDHIFNLVANPKATVTHVDAVYARKCVQFILRTVIGSLLGEKAQIAAAKEIAQVITKQMNLLSPDAMTDGTGGNQTIDFTGSQHILVCALHELGSLVQTLGTSASPLVSEPNSGIIPPVISVLLHISPAARLAAAWCLRCIAVALPSYLTPLLDQCMGNLSKMKASPEATSGYCFALAALLGGVHQCPLGIPHAIGKKIFSLAEELLRTASQNSRLSLQRTQSGWLLLGALMTLGAPVAKNHLPRMLLLWKNAFPRSVKELEAEKSRGDAFTWQVTLEGRMGALATMQSFIQHCGELVTEDVTRRLMAPIECALTMLAHMPGIVKNYGAHLKAAAAMVRLRLYDVLALLPPKTYEGAFNALLRELVAEFTLTDNPANTTTSMLRSMCHIDDSVILGSWLQETDHKAIEDQLEPNRRLDKEHLQPNSASGSGALEHDAISLYLRLQPGEGKPGPLPLGVAVIDSSVKLYGLIFPRVPHKHRLKMLQHFADCIKHAKSHRQQAVQINIFTAVLCALKFLAENKTGFGQLEVRKEAVKLVLGALGSANPILRCAAGEALGRMAQVVEDSRFIAEMAQFSFDKLKSARDVVTRTGHSLALGCLHRYVGGMGSGQHLNMSVSILLALAQDTTSPVVQVWSLHALALIADSGGPMYRGYVEPTLSLVLSLLLSVPPSNTDVHQCLGKCLAALITTIGPELQGNTGSIATARLYCLVCCAIMQDHPDSLVQAEAIACLQQLHMFAPRHVNLATLVPHLCATLNSNHLLLRRAAVACMRQLAQREAREVSEHALTLAVEDRTNKPGIIITETGLEGALFELLDSETDAQLCKDVHDTLISMLHSLAEENLTRWFMLVKNVLAAATESGTPVDSPMQETATGNEDDDDDDDEDDDTEFKAAEADITHPLIAPRWPTRVFATECMRRIVGVCEGNNANFDLALARELKRTNGKGDYLVLHLSELVRVAFIAATADSDQLRLAGLATLQDIIHKFSKVPEPEFPGHVILEQYQAQVGAALRPAFSPDTPSDVTAAACEVCSTWIGSGVARDLNDLRRVHQLLVSSLEKLKSGKGKAQLYNEGASTMEKLAVLKAWAEVYIVAENRERERDTTIKEEEDEFGDAINGESLLSLVKPELPTLSKHWLSALKDHALLSLPPELSSQLPAEGGTFYWADTIDSSRLHYKKSWAPMLYAVALWLNEGGHATNPKESSSAATTPVEPPPANMQPDELDDDRFFLLIGICMEAMCSPASVQPLENVEMCLKSMYALLDKPWPRSRLGKDSALSIEVLNVMHRLILTRENPSTQQLVLGVVQQVVKAAQEHFEAERTRATDEDTGAEDQENPPANSEKVVNLGEGGESGEITPGKSVVYATLEVNLCVLIRYIPALNPALPSTGFTQPHRVNNMSEEVAQLIASTLNIMMELPGLCSPRGTLSVLPTILFLVTGVIRELAPRSPDLNGVPLPVAMSLQVLKAFCRSHFLQIEECRAGWIKLLQSTMATILAFANPDHENDQPGVDQSILMLTLAVFLTSCPTEVTTPKNVQQPCVDIFKEAWQSQNDKIILTCVQTLASLFQHPDRELSTPYIHQLGPAILENMPSFSKNRPSSDVKLNIAKESIHLLEGLVAAAEDNNRIQLISMLVPLLISFLLDNSELAGASKPSRDLHLYALQRLMQVGPQYPEQFRTVMGSSVNLRTKLEAAVKANQQAKKPQEQKAQEVKLKPVKPSIQLKTDFSDFAKGGK